MNRRALALTAAIYGLFAVVLAALGAHLLPADQPAAQKLWATALQFHLFHAAALLGIAALAEIRNSSAIYWSGMAMAIGVLIFSGTLYLRALAIDVLPGPLTPVGGLITILAWSALIMTMIKKTRI